MPAEYARATGFIGPESSMLFISTGRGKRTHKPAPGENANATVMGPAARVGAGNPGAVAALLGETADRIDRVTFADPGTGGVTLPTCTP